MEAKSIKWWRGGEEGRGEERRQGEKERNTRGEKTQKGGPRSQRGVPGHNRGEQGELYPTLKGGYPSCHAAPARDAMWHSGLLGSNFFPMPIFAHIWGDILATF